MNEFDSLSKEGLDLLEYMHTLPASTTVSERVLFNSRMRYVDSITAKLKILNGCMEDVSGLEYRVTICPECGDRHLIGIDYDGPAHCRECGRIYYTQPPKFLPTAHLPNKKTEDKILDRPAFASGLLEKEKDNIQRGRCPLCNRDITEFRDSLSEKEFHISGMCQACQDETFGVDSP